MGRLLSYPQRWEMQETRAACVPGSIRAVCAVGRFLLLRTESERTPYPHPARRSPCPWSCALRWADVDCRRRCCHFGSPRVWREAIPERHLLECPLQAKRLLSTLCPPVSFCQRRLPDPRRPRKTSYSVRTVRGAADAQTLGDPSFGVPLPQVQMRAVTVPRSLGVQDWKFGPLL